MRSLPYHAAHALNAPRMPRKYGSHEITTKPPLITRNPSFFKVRGSTSKRFQLLPAIASGAVVNPLVQGQKIGRAAYHAVTAITPGVSPDLRQAVSGVTPTDDWHP